MKKTDVVRYIIGTLFAFAGIAGIMAGDFLAGLLMGCFGISLFPILYEKIEKLKGKNIQIIIPIIVFLLTSLVMPSTKNKEYINVYDDKNYNWILNYISEENIADNAENVINNSIDIDNKNSSDINTDNNSNGDKFLLSDVPAYSGSSYCIINNNNPFFENQDLVETSYERYSDLDQLGRCGIAIANIGKDIMPTEERGDIGSVKPTGWHTVKYNGIDGNYLYNRCHLIGYQLTAENANQKNLITGTRYMNVQGMLPFENMVADYIKETNNHVLYRVTPIFSGNNLLASGVLMEAKSVEDDGKGILFNVYCYNVQPGIEINYETGESSGPEYTGSLNSSSNTSNSSGENTLVVPTNPSTTEEETEQETTQSTLAINNNSQTYILNTNSKKFHEQSCGSASRIKGSNKSTYTGTRDELINKGYSPCGNCDP